METKQKRLEAKYAALQVVQNIEKLGNAKQAQIAREGSHFFLFFSLYVMLLKFENEDEKIKNIITDRPKC